MTRPARSRVRRLLVAALAPLLFGPLALAPLALTGCDDGVEDGATLEVDETAEESPGA